MQRNSSISAEQTLDNIHPYFVAINDLSTGELFEYYLTKFYEINDQKKVMILKENNTSRYYLAFYNKNGVAEFFNQHEKTTSSDQETCKYSFMQLSEENYQLVGQPDFQNNTTDFKLMTGNPAFQRALISLLLAAGGADCYKQARRENNRFFSHTAPLADHAHPEGIDHAQPTRGIEL